MTLIKTTYLGDLRTEAVHLDSGSKINTSAPKDNNGDGLLFSPTDLFATSLGCCMLTIIGMTAKTHGFFNRKVLLSNAKFPNERR